MECKQIIFPEVNKAALADKKLPAVGPKSVVVRTVVSTISPGTERANITGDPNVNAIGPSPKFPRSSGYNVAGIVTEVGSEVKSVKVGDRVAVYWSKHQTINIVDENNVVKIEDDRVSFEAAAMSFIASFSMAAIRKTRVEIGESAMVMGVGLLGLLAVKLLKAAGAVPVIAVDPNPARREMALANGADYAFDPFEEGFAANVKKITNGGVNAVIEVTGVGGGFNGALDCMAKFGRIALLGCTRSSDFTVDYYHKIHAPGITVIGAHTLARPEKESSSGWFTHRDDIKSILKLCAAGRLELDNIVGETHTPDECAEVYDRLVNDKNFPIAVQFDWRNFETDK